MTGSGKPRRGTATRLEQAAAGHRSAVGWVLEEFEPLLVAHVRRTLGARFPTDGEDLLQDLRLAVVEALPKLEGRRRSSVARWLRLLVRHRTVDWARRRARLRDGALQSLDRTGVPEPSISGTTPTASARGRESVESLHAAIERVPERYRDVLRFVADRAPSLDELAEYLGKDKEAARKQASRAMSHLRRILAASSDGGLAPT